MPYSLAGDLLIVRFFLVRVVVVVSGILNSSEKRDIFDQCFAQLHAVLYQGKDYSVCFS